MRSFAFSLVTLISVNANAADLQTMALSGYGGGVCFLAGTDDLGCHDYDTSHIVWVTDAGSPAIDLDANYYDGVFSLHADGTIWLHSFPSDVHQSNLFLDLAGQDPTEITATNGRVCVGFQGGDVNCYSIDQPNRFFTPPQTFESISSNGMSVTCGIHTNGFTCWSDRGTVVGDVSAPNVQQLWPGWGEIRGTNGNGTVHKRDVWGHWTSTEVIDPDEVFHARGSGRCGYISSFGQPARFGCSRNLFRAPVVYAGEHVTHVAINPRAQLACGIISAPSGDELSCWDDGGPFPGIDVVLPTP